MQEVPKIEIVRITIIDEMTTEMCFVNTGSKRNTAILILPALGVPARSYSKLLLCLAKVGYNAAVFDLRSQGNSSVTAGKGINYGYQELLTEDIPAAIREVYALFGQRIKLLGHSLGGQLGSLYATSNDSRIESLILCTSCSVYFKSWKGFEQIRVLMGSQFARLYARLAGYFPGKRFGFGGRTFQKLIEDWGQQALTGKYKIANTHIDYEKGLSEIRISILILYLKVDFFAPPKAVLHLREKFKSTAVSQHCITDVSLNHFNWIKHPEAFIKKIVDWDDSLTLTNEI